MKDLARKLRGLTGLGLTWGAAWGAIGAGIGVAIEALSPGSGAGTVLEWALGMGAYGFVAGVGFGKLLWFLEGRRTSVSELPLARTALWGVAGGAVVPVLFGLAGFFEAGTTAGDVAGAIAVTSALGGLFAAGSVALARRAELEEEERGPGAFTPVADPPLLAAEPIGDRVPGRGTRTAPRPLERGEREPGAR